MRLQENQALVRLVWTKSSASCRSPTSRYAVRSSAGERATTKSSNSTVLAMPAPFGWLARGSPTSVLLRRSGHERLLGPARGFSRQQKRPRASSGRQGRRARSEVLDELG